MKTCQHLWQHLAEFFLERGMFQTNVIAFWITFRQKSCHLWENVEKYGRAGQATDDNKAQAHCMLDT